MNSSPECSQAAWDSIFECMLSVCNWVNQAQLKQLWSFYSELYLIKLDYYDENGSSSGSGHQVIYQCIMAGIVLKTVQQDRGK